MAKTVSEPTVSLFLRVPPAVAERIRSQSDTCGLSVNRLIVAILEGYLVALDSDLRPTPVGSQEVQG